MIGTALIAVCALTAILASAAEAAPAHFEWPAGTTKVKRVANTLQTFYFPTIGAWQCELVEAEATVSGREAPSFLTTKGAVPYPGGPTYCPGGGSISIQMNECQYQFVAGTSTGIGKSVGTMNIVCPAGKSIEMHTLACSMKIRPQEGLGPVNYSTVSPVVPQVAAELNLKDVKYETVGWCTSLKTLEAEFTGTVTFGGFNSAGVANSLKVVP
jgi:hypothetical protein